MVRGRSEFEGWVKNMNNHPFSKTELSGNEPKSLEETVDKKDEQVINEENKKLGVIPEE